MNTQPYQRFEPIAQGLDTLQEKLSSIEAEIQALEERGIIRANPHMRDGCYMYLLYPTKRGEKRKREYVGANKTNQKAALEKIKNGHKADRLIRQQEEIKHRIRRTDEALEQISNWLN